MDSTPNHHPDFATVAFTEVDFATAVPTWAMRFQYWTETQYTPCIKEWAGFLNEKDRDSYLRTTRAMNFKSEPFDIDPNYTPEQLEFDFMQPLPW
jgi:hypothetical protein